MLNFTVGPVMACEEVLKIGGQQVPYFRTSEFSELMKENEAYMKKFTYAAEDARVIFVTGSGTASMEASIMNFFTPADKVLAVNGGSFGARFVQICHIHDVPCDEIKLERGRKLTAEMLEPYENKGYTGFIINMNETSTGVKYDIEMVSEFCKRNNIFLVVDCISAFLCDEFYLDQWNVGAMITGSQKALACPPGISIVVLSKEAQDRVAANDVKSLYFDFKSALKNGERGQTPFTPAVGTLIQINARLKKIDENGVEAELARIHAMAEYFREGIKEFPFEIASESMGNAVTPLTTKTAKATDIFRILKDEYQIWICPNGGDMAETSFRVGHIGELTTKDYDTLFDALRDMQRRGLL